MRRRSDDSLGPCAACLIEQTDALPPRELTISQTPLTGTVPSFRRSTRAIRWGGAGCWPTKSLMRSPSTFRRGRAKYQWGKDRGP